MSNIKILLEAVKTQKERQQKMKKKMASIEKQTVRSANSRFGYYGTHYSNVYDQFGHEYATGHADKHWDKAIKHITKHMETLGGDEIDARNFLDSTHGRHLANAVQDEGGLSKAINRSYKSQTHFHAALKNTIRHRDLFDK